MKNSYLIRLDDACPTMNLLNWERIFNMLDRYGITPMVGIIPHNEDPMQEINVSDIEFWDKARVWEQKGYAIALHGYNHCYISEKGMEGLNPLWRRSEFAGVPYEKQCQKIKDGYTILKNHGLTPKYFFAPSHTFDENTLKALKENTDIRIISDTIATKPYKMGDFTFIPQVGGHCSEIKIKGLWTFCLHPSVMSDADFNSTERFLLTHKDEFIKFNEINLASLKNKDWFSRLLSCLYFTKRKFKGIK